MCYRLGNGAIEFLLVRTRGGRWTFPKGGLEPGLTHAQAAALEAFEEAGVHGRMEDVCFAQYVRGKRRLDSSSTKSPRKERAISAYLCEVSRLEPPQERGRNPTWFSALQAKRSLREDRAPADGAELARVVDRAVTRIQQLHTGANVAAHSEVMRRDALQKVQFEALQGMHSRTVAALFEAFERGTRPPATEDAIVTARPRRVLRMGEILQLAPPRSRE